MATYLRQEIAQYAKVTMKMDFNKFTDRQIKNIIKQLKDGCMSSGYSATATIARWLHEKYPMPSFSYGKYYFDWKKIPKGHAFFTELMSAASITKLASGLQEWQVRYCDEAIERAMNNVDTGSVRVYGYDKHVIKKLNSSMKINNELNGELKEFLDKMERRELGEVEVDFLQFANSY